ncbi:MAG TPA: RNA pseudouridine synthase [Candidatus Marinimicrobia bacterium]|nr:RNA pseudouridine synthase [Candidatus Neomarinimicrobiota bacterium]
MSNTQSKNELVFRVDEAEGLRLDSYLSQKIDSISRSKIHQLIQNGEALVNSAVAKPSHRLKNDDIVTIHIPPPEPLEITPEDMPLSILYEDEHYFALNKPSGIVVHPGAGNFEGTLVSGLVNYTNQLSSLGGVLRPGLVHRLDKDTTGVLIVAKNDEAHWKLGQQFAGRKVYKEYRALVWGTPEPLQGVIEQPIGRSAADRKKFAVTDSGKFSRSRYEVLNSYCLISAVKVILETGRTHQIRVHLNYIGHPVVGDVVYGAKKRRFSMLEKRYYDLGNQVVAQTKRQMLHAYCLRFQHPFSGKEIQIIAPLPDDFIRLEELLQNWDKSDGY